MHRGEITFFALRKSKVFGGIVCTILVGCFCFFWFVVNYFFAFTNTEISNEGQEEGFLRLQEIPALTGLFFWE